MAYSQEHRDMLLKFINQNVMSFYRDWFYGGKKEPLESMASMAVTLICSGVSGMLDSKH